MKGEYCGTCGEGEENADYGGMVQPSQQHVSPDPYMTANRNFVRFAHVSPNKNIECINRRKVSSANQDCNCSNLQFQTLVPLCKLGVSQEIGKICNFCLKLINRWCQMTFQNFRLYVCRYVVWKYMQI